MDDITKSVQLKKCEPCNLRKWIVPSGTLFTCGRPGRGTFSGSKKQIPEDIIDLWVDGLPKAPQLSIISLLGHKHPSGRSEFSYYPFRSCMEDGTTPTFQDWLNSRYGPRFIVEEFPTEDRLPMASCDAVEAIRNRVRTLLDSGAVVIIVDSAGVQRTGEVCRTIGMSQSN
jgi:hypothetical protein